MHGSGGATTEPATTSSLKGRTDVAELTRAERTAARRGAEVRATVPDAEYGAVVDVTAAEHRAREAGVTLTAVTLGAIARALTTVPRLNAAYRDGRFELYERVNLGVSFVAGDAPVLPVIHDAAARSDVAIDAELADLTDRAHRGELAAAELTGATFTVVPAAGPAIARATPLITPPHAGAIAIGAVRDAAVVRGGEVVGGRTVTLVLVCDHRIAYPTHAAALLAAITDELDQGE